MVAEEEAAVEEVEEVAADAAVVDAVDEEEDEADEVGEVSAEVGEAADGDFRREGGEVEEGFDVIVLTFLCDDDRDLLAVAVVELSCAVLYLGSSRGQK